MVMNLLFVCAGNSVRSQIAEGWARHLADAEKVMVSSAGIQACGVIPSAIRTMREVGIDISGHGTRTLSDPLLQWADYIITMADSIRPFAQFFPKSATHIHWSIRNPDAMPPSVERDIAYARVRDDIKRRVEKLLVDIA